jgi:hypothetical protein
MKPKASALLIVVLACVPVFAQSPATAGTPHSVHVQGTVFDPIGAVVPGTEVTFESGQVSRIVIADDSGFYQADIPVGLYTMTAQAQVTRYSGFALFRRPQFQLVPSKGVILNAHLGVARNNCDIVVAGSSREPTLEDQKDNCGAEDSCSAPSNEDGKFQLYVRYPKRSRIREAYVYSSESLGNYRNAVLVEYNLLTLQADQVSYDAKHRRLVAIGRVVVEDQSGKTSHAGALTFELGNGHATLLSTATPQPPPPANPSATAPDPSSAPPSSPL